MGWRPAPERWRSVDRGGDGRQGRGSWRAGGHGVPNVPCARETKENCEPGVVEERKGTLNLICVLPAQVTFGTPARRTEHLSGFAGRPLAQTSPDCRVPNGTRGL